MSQFPEQEPKVRRCSSAASLARKYPPFRTENPMARCPGLRPAEIPANVPPVPHGAADHVKVRFYLSWYLRAAAHGQRIATAFWQEIKRTKSLLQGSDYVGLRLSPVCRAIHIAQPHSLTGRIGQ